MVVPGGGSATPADWFPEQVTVPIPVQGSGPARAVSVKIAHNAPAAMLRSSNTTVTNLAELADLLPLLQRIDFDDRPNPSISVPPQAELFLENLAVAVPAYQRVGRI